MLCYGLRAIYGYGFLSRVHCAYLLLALAGGALQKLSIKLKFGW